MSKRSRRRKRTPRAGPPPPPPPAPIRDLVMAFGMHKGRLVREVPTPYLTWVLKEHKMPAVFMQHVREVLADRGHSIDGTGVFAFGTYYGRAFEEVPLQYLSWALCNVESKFLTDADRALIRSILRQSDYPEDGWETAPTASEPDAPGETPDAY